MFCRLAARPLAGGRRGLIPTYSRVKLSCLRHAVVSRRAGRARNHHPYTPRAAGTTDGRESTSSRENTRAGVRKPETSADCTAAAYSGPRCPAPLGMDTRAAARPRSQRGRKSRTRGPRSHHTRRCPGHSLRPRPVHHRPLHERLARRKHGHHCPGAHWNRYPISCADVTGYSSAACTPPTAAKEASTNT
jgi:hypothetical protein